MLNMTSAIISQFTILSNKYKIHRQIKINMTKYVSINMDRYINIKMNKYVKANKKSNYKNVSLAISNNINIA